MRYFSCQQEGEAEVVVVVGLLHGAGGGRRLEQGGRGVLLQRPIYAVQEGKAKPSELGLMRGQRVGRRLQLRGRVCFASG